MEPDTPPPGRSVVLEALTMAVEGARATSPISTVSPRELRYRCDASDLCLVREVIGAIRVRGDGRSRSPIPTC